MIKWAFSTNVKTDYAKVCAAYAQAHCRYDQSNMGHFGFVFCKFCGTEISKRTQCRLMGTTDIPLWKSRAKDRGPYKPKTKLGLLEHPTLY